MSPKYLCQLSDTFFVGGQPTKRGYTILASWGITAIISMRRTQPKHTPNTMQLLHLPTPDHGPIALGDLKKAIAFIQAQSKNGKVYVHCHWGEGRAASVAAAYLISRGMPLTDAIDFIKQRRVFINPNKKQVERLREFAEAY